MKSAVKDYLFPPPAGLFLVQDVDFLIFSPYFFHMLSIIIFSISAYYQTQGFKGFLKKIELKKYW